MEDQPFDSPVLILTGRHLSVKKKVETVLEAAECLSHNWPEGAAGAKHLAAREACVVALEGLTDARTVREAFEAAADEAGILVRQP